MRKVALINLVAGLWMLGLVSTASEKLLDQVAITYVVCPKGPPACPFNKIQAAIDAAPEGATITIKAGTYEENLLIRKSLILQAMDGERVVVKSATEGLPTLLLVSGRPIQVSVKGLTVLPARQHQGNGIEIMGTVAAHIERNVIQGYDWGIFILGKPNGFAFPKLPVSISENTLRDNRTSIMIWHSDSVAVTQNTIQSKPSSPEYMAGVFILDSKQVIASGNFVQEGGLSGILIGRSEEIKIMGNLIKSNPMAGIFVRGSQIVDLLDNRVEQNGWWGVAITAERSQESWVSLKGNHITQQEGYGLAIERLNQVTTCQSNEIRDNKDGDYLVQSPLFSLQPRRDPKAEEELRKRCERQ